MNKQKFTEQLIEFLNTSLTPYHAVKSIKHILLANGYQELKEADAWQLKSGQGYFVIRGDSSLVAFHPGPQKKKSTGYLLIGSHTDSPHLKLKPHPLMKHSGVYQLEVEVYGGVLLQSWFDRNLALAGRIVGEDQKAQLVSELVESQDSLCFIPRLAIHLDREANTKGIKDSQIELNPIFTTEFDKKENFNNFLLNYFKKIQSGLKIKKLLDYDLSFYDCEPAKLLGLKDEFLVGARLDNLLSCFVSVLSLVDKDIHQPTIAVFHDHEEIGSHSYLGASGSLVEDLMIRLIPNVEDRLRIKSQSLFLSLDNAHGVHPNFPDKHDPNHAPIIGKGPAIKVNSSQRYATTGFTSAWFKQKADQAKMPYQTFVSHNAMPCGSTIGPLASTKLGIKAVDIGIPTFAMHSIREMAAIEDVFTLYQILLSI